MATRNTKDPTRIKSRQVTISPSMAAAWLDRGQINFRKIKHHRVSAYALIMGEGRWDLNGETIKLNGDGVVVDGQHRLLACIEADAPFTTLVVEGVEEDMVLEVDVGAKRSAADYLRKQGKSNVSALAAATTLCMRYDAGLRGSYLFGSGTRETIFTIREIIEFVGENPGLEHSCSVVGGASALQMPPAALAFVHYKASRLYGLRLADQFVAELLKGGGGKGSPLAALRSFCAGRKYAVMDRRAAIMVAFNAWIQGRSLARIFTRAKEDMRVLRKVSFVSRSSIPVEEPDA